MYYFDKSVVVFALRLLNIFSSMTVVHVGKKYQMLYNFYSSNTDSTPYLISYKFNKTKNVTNDSQ